MTGLRRRIDADLFAGLVQPFIFDHAVDERIQREILADAYIVAGVNFCSDRRTIMEPAWIFWPPYTLTPRRCELESLPLRELP